MAHSRSWWLDASGQRQEGSKTVEVRRVGGKHEVRVPFFGKGELTMSGGVGNGSFMTDSGERLALEAVRDPDGVVHYTMIDSSGREVSGGTVAFSCQPTGFVSGRQRVSTQGLTIRQAHGRALR
jgi:hypothetical protein